MLRCLACGNDLDRPSRFCPSCGSLTSGSPDDAATILTTPQPAAPPKHRSSTPEHSPPPSSGPSAAWLHSQSSVESGFAPGTLLGGRFRIIGLLGRGGMGDVYRADDLLLGQPVALKFLPVELAQNADRLARFYGEVRIARGVSHPNVCRVYDVGELEGQPYMSMELVDGDDLSSLLRRIGRLPEDKALDVARQLCAGLAAAHEKGVLHRDLKPANVLIDGQGKVRITDFGLAVLAENFRPSEARAGTPAYMAPEQLAKNEVSVQSDIYALGVVLYEVFTGKRAYSGNTMVEVRKQQASRTLADPSTVLEDMDPTIERAILRCLEADPQQRPPSALAVAMSLPGGDPLAAALAAGELPSPEVVAAAGGAVAIRRRIAWTALGVVALGAILLPLLGRDVLVVNRVALDKPPAVLIDRARTILTELGHGTTPADRASGFASYGELLRWVRDHDRGPNRWERVERGPMSAVGFWYRQHDQHMGSWKPLDGPRVSPSDPPLVESGMALVYLDPEGRLTDLCVVPPQQDSTAGAAIELEATDWSRLFAYAGLDPARFATTTPMWVPPVYSDARAAWTGTGGGSDTLRIEAGSYRGRANYFQIIGPWTRPSRMQPRPESTSERVSQYINVAFIAGILLGTGFLVRRSIRLGHGDLRAATRLALFMLGVSFAAWLVAANHATHPGEEWNDLLVFLGMACFMALLYFALYLGLEPVVRRRWPDSLISWNRLLAGRLQDPRVGRDVLLGLAAGMVIVTLEWIYHPIMRAFVGRAPQPIQVSLGGLDGWAHTFALFLSMIANVLFFPMAILMLLILFRMVLRKPWLAAGVLVAGLAYLPAATAEFPVPAFVVNTIQLVLIFGVLLRLGLVAAIATQLVNSLYNFYFPITTDFSRWYAPITVFLGVVVVALALFGFRTALTGRPIVGPRMARSGAER